MSNTISPNMNLVIPGVGTEPGPEYGFDLNASLTLVDQHDHTAGKGVQISPAGININSDLSFGGNFAIDLAGLTLIAQNSTPDESTIYQSGVDLYFVDALGNNIRITESGGVAGTPGSISNLVAPASATYVSGSSTFVWQSNTNIAANMDFGAALLRNLSPNSTYALTLQPPSLSSNYTITLPTIPASQKIMTMDNSGIQSAVYVVDNSTIEISTNTIQVKDLGITSAELAADSVITSKILDEAVTGAKIDEATVEVSNMAASTAADGASSGSFTTTSGTFVNACSTTLDVIAGRPVFITFKGDNTTGNGCIGSNSNGTSYGKFNIRDLTNGVNLHQYTFDLGVSGATIRVIPSGCLNFFYIPSVSGSTNIALQAAASTGAAATVAVQGVIMRAVQI